MVPEGLTGRGWISMAECFQAVVNFFSSSRKANFSLKVAGRRGGVTFADAVKSSPPSEFTGLVSSKEGRSKVVGGSDVSCPHAETEMVHADLAAAFSGSKTRAFNVCSSGECRGDFFCVKHLHVRLFALQMEMDRLLKSLDKLGHFGPGELGQSCRDCGNGLSGTVGSCGEVGRELGPGSGGEARMGLVSNPFSTSEEAVGPGLGSTGPLLSLERAGDEEGLGLNGSPDPILTGNLTWPGTPPVPRFLGATSRIWKLVRRRLNLRREWVSPAFRRPWRWVLPKFRWSRLLL